MMNGAGKRTEWLAKYGPWALVTGASDGIGREMAKELASRGLNVILSSRRQDRLQILAAEIEKSFKVETRIIAADLGGVSGVALLVREAAECDVGLLVAAAGFGTAGGILVTDLESELNMIDVNCRAVFELTKVFSSRFVKRGGGGIVLVSSIVAFQGVPRAANYAATKAYVQSLAEGLGHELAAHKIDVTVAAPGPVGTGFAKRSNLKMAGADDPRTVARQTLNALGQKTTVRPGLRGMILGLSLATLPRRVRTFIMGGIMAGMTSHINERKP